MNLYIHTSLGKEGVGGAKGALAHCSYQTSEEAKVYLSMCTVLVIDIICFEGSKPSLITIGQARTGSTQLSLGQVGGTDL